MTEQEWLECRDPKPMLDYLKGPASSEMREMFGRQMSVTLHNSKRISDRKARLLAVSCCRQLSDLYDEPHCHRLIEYGRQYDVFESRGVVIPEPDCCLKAIRLAEQSAEESVSEAELRALREELEALFELGTAYAACHDSTDDYEHRLVATSEVAGAIRCACSDYPIRCGVFGETIGAFENLGGVVWNTAQAAKFCKGLAYVQSFEGGDPDNMAANAEILRDIVGNPFRPATVNPSWLSLTVISLAQSIYAEGAFDRLPILADALEDAGCDNADILNHCRQPGEHVRGCWALDLLLGKS